MMYGSEEFEAAPILSRRRGRVRRPARRGRQRTPETVSAKHGSQRRTATLLIAALAAACGSSPVWAASWDPIPGVAGSGDGVVNGGSGVWDPFSANWTADGGFTNA